MQLYQDHVVFQSFSDLYYVEVRKEQQRNMQQARKAAAAAALEHSSRRQQQQASYSQQSSPASSRAPSIVFNDLSRTPSSKSTSSSSSSASSVATSDNTDGAQYYPAGLENSSVQQRLRAKEADLATLHDVPLFHHSEHHELSLRRF